MLCFLYLFDIINLPQNSEFWRPWGRSLLKTLQLKEKIKVTSNFSILSKQHFLLFQQPLLLSLMKAQSTVPHWIYHLLVLSDWTCLKFVFLCRVKITWKTECHYINAYIMQQKKYTAWDYNFETNVIEHFSFLPTTSCVCETLIAP